MNDNTEITHSFSRTQALKYGVHGAILLGYLVNRIKNSTNIRDGKRWFYDSVADLAEHYPYLSKTAINNARLVLTDDNGPIITANYNEWPRDKTIWYSVQDDRTLQAQETSLLYFRASEATVYGILEAVIMNNLRYWIEEKQKQALGYKYHGMSPRKLEKVFQGTFSRNSVSRALKHLVEAGVLVAEPSDKANFPMSYRFSEPSDVDSGAGGVVSEVAQPRTTTGGPTENEVAQKSVRGPTENGGGPTEFLGGPTENEGGPTENEVAQPRTRVAQPRTTLPISNYLKDDSLKGSLKVCLKEDRFKTSSAGSSSQNSEAAATLPLAPSVLTDVISASSVSAFPDALATSATNDVTSASSVTAFPDSPVSLLTPNPFPEPIASSVSQDSPISSLASDLTSASSVTAFPDSPLSLTTDLTSANPVSQDSPLSSLATDQTSANPASPSTPAPYFTTQIPPQLKRTPIEELPYYKFLDLDGVHKCCWEVMLIHHSSTDPLYQDLSDTIVGGLANLISATDPATIYALLKLPDQLTLNGELLRWSGKFLETTYDQHISAPDLPDNAYYRELFLAHSHCFLNMAFHCIKFESFRIYVGKPYARIGQSLYSRVSGWIEEQQEIKHTTTIEERAAKYSSPDLDKEADPNLSAAEKMQIFRQSLQSRNRIGKFDEWGQFTEQVVEVTHSTPILARQFFQLNSHYTVQDLNRVIDACLKLPTRSADEDDPQWHARRGYKISLLLNNLTQVATQLNMLSQLPTFTPLPIEETKITDNQH